jgi:hypothetical protein
MPLKITLVVPANTIGAPSLRSQLVIVALQFGSVSVGLLHPQSSITGVHGPQLTVCAKALGVPIAANVSATKTIPIQRIKEGGGNCHVPKITDSAVGVNTNSPNIQLFLLNQKSKKMKTPAINLFRRYFNG